MAVPVRIGQIPLLRLGVSTVYNIDAATAADQEIVAFVAVDPVVVFATVDLIVTGAAVLHIAPTVSLIRKIISQDKVVSATAFYVVVTDAPVEVLRRVRPDDPVVTSAAEDSAKRLFRNYIKVDIVVSVEAPVHVTDNRLECNLARYRVGLRHRWKRVVRAFVVNIDQSRDYGLYVVAQIRNRITGHPIDYLPNQVGHRYYG